MKANATIVLMAALLVPSPVGARGLRAVAKCLVSAARKAKVGRVAVLPFKSAVDDGAADGEAISERLTTRIVELGGVQIIERSMLGALLSEHKLERTGLVAESGVRPLGRVAAAEAVVVGSYTMMGSEVVVEARLIDMETGVILAAAEKTVTRDWAVSTSLWVPAPEFIAQVPELPAFSEQLDAMADAPADPCADAGSRVDELERGILDIKARYWAGKLRAGESLERLKSNPGSTISDPDLRRSFYERLKFWYGQESVPSLTSSEVRRFVSMDGKAYSLYQKCGA